LDIGWGGDDGNMEDEDKHRAGVGGGDDDFNDETVEGIGKDEVDLRILLLFFWRDDKLLLSILMRS
jgi:hypothetical protein